MTRRATTFPSLGNPKDIDRLAPAVKQILENWMGNTGDGLDKVLTLQDLADVGLITVRTVGGKTRLSGLTPGVLPGGSADSYVFATPSAPTGLAASGALGGVNLSWDASSDAYYAYTEILRAATNDAGVAVVVGKSIFNVYRDELWSGASNYYWVRFVNSDGATVKTGPLNSANGTLGEVGVDPAYVLSVLQSQITESQLYGTLNTRINLIDTPTTGLIDRMTSTESATTTNATDITALETTVNDGTSGVAANAAAVTALDSRVTTAEGNITASAADITALETTVNNPTTGVSANASAVSALETTVNDGTSGVAANASAITTLQSTVGNNTTAISTEASTRATADGLLNAEYTIKADVNGHVAGYGVAVSGGVSGPITSEIIMLADKFAIGLPAATWTAAQAFTLGQYAKPTVGNGFIYKCTTAGTTGGTEPTWPTTLALTVADGTVVWTCVSITSTVPFIVGSVGGNPAVVMDTAIIADASIGNAKIGDLAADKITTGDLTATLTINGGAIYGGVVATSSGTGYRAGMSGVDSYPFWAGTGTKNDANAIFFVKNDGTAKFSGTVTFGSSSSGYANISDKPTSLSGINGTEGTKLSGIADGADVTSANTAAAIAGQGALATASTADWSTQVAGTGKPANNADVTSANTSADTSAVNGVAASTVQSYASTAGAWRHASDTTKIDGGDIYTNTVTANAIAANAITADKILAGAVTATKISVTSLSALSANLGNVTAGQIQSGSISTSGSFLSGNTTIGASVLNIIDTSDFATSGSGMIKSSLTADPDGFSWTNKTGTTLTGCSGITWAHPAGSSVIDLANGKGAFSLTQDDDTLSGYGYAGTGASERIVNFNLKTSSVALLTLGSQTAGNLKQTLNVLSNNAIAIRGVCSGTGTAVYAYNTGTGIGLSATASNDYGVVAYGNIAWGGIKVSNGVRIAEQGSTPSNLQNGTDCQLYMKADKLVIAYKDSGGTQRYKYLNLGTDTSGTWFYTTTAP